MEQEHIVIIGKGGVGKSSVASNVSAALAADGCRVLQIGYGHALDSTSTLRGGREAVPLFIGRERSFADRVAEGFNGVFCMEAGRLSAANRAAVLRRVSAEIGRLAPEIVVHDVSWDSYGERLAQPFGKGAVKVFVVVSPDFPAITAANSIFRTLGGYPFSRRLTYGGLIANGVNATFCQSMVADFAKSCDATVHSSIPHSLVVMMSELYGKTVLEAAPLSQHAFVYRKVAHDIRRGAWPAFPQYLETCRLREWGQQWAVLIEELETGFIRDGAGI